MGTRIFQVDAFTEAPFGGNPAAVCLLNRPADESWMQNMATEMNLSETAFLIEQEDGFNLRWFTPAAEVDLCGHATLASAHILWETGRLGKGEQARFHTHSGLLTAKRQGDWIEMDFPAEPAVSATPPDKLIKALNVRPNYVGENRFDFLVEVDSEEAVRGLEPDLAALAKVTKRGVIVTSLAHTPAYDFVSRFFAPAVGIPEDPVTGSAHCCLGPFWSERLGKVELVAHQASRRGGTLRIRVAGGRVFLAGKGITIMRGELV